MPLTQATARVAGLAAVLCGVWLAAAGHAQGVRAHTRLVPSDDAVTASQAETITLTVAPTQRQLIQTWVRTAGALDEARKSLTACVSKEDAALIEPNQRVRAFPPDSKSSIYQARISSITPGARCTAIVAELSGPIYGSDARYVMEIIVDRGYRLAVANEAIIEREGKQIIYVQLHPGHYDRREIETGLQGERYTEVLSGLREGAQVVTIGSFFVDAEFELKMSPGGGMDAHHHH